MLNRRRQDILKIIVREYVLTGLPVSSDAVSRKGLGVSAATIRNEMLELEDEGYLTQPHTSAGRIPSDRGYRLYIESLMGDVELPPSEQRLIRHQFYQVENEVEEWTRLAAAILCRMLRSVAIVTLPKPYESRLKHLELVSLQEFLALLLVVLREAKIRQQVIALREPASQETLSASARKLRALYAGRTLGQIPVKETETTELEQQIVNVVKHIMLTDEAEAYGEPYVDGLRHILEHPEFSSTRKVAAIFELLEQRSMLKTLLPQVLTGEGLRVLVGSENKQDVMHDCSMVISRYGIPGEVCGAIGVVGPTRMEYDRAIPIVRYLSSVMSELVGELYG
ncbi:MAG: heat-inducible transcription repressor HrcA [Dehalococcoidia bacterium]|nr:heat-inducible transcription repressor HrcA [Dehalococcoidia bacterium]